MSNKQQSSIDDRLRDIRLDVTANLEDGCRLTSRGVDQIKAAFADEGYRSPEELSINEGAAYAMYRRLNKDKPKAEVDSELMSVMTGPQFYSRFEKELGKPKERSYIAGGGKLVNIKIYEQKEVLEAAKRAAGITEAKDD